MEVEVEADAKMCSEFCFVVCCPVVLGVSLCLLHFSVVVRVVDNA